MIREAGREVARPIFFAVLIIIIVYLPILTLQGVEGKMFRPMALTVVFALVGSLILALTLMPVLAALLFRRKTAGAGTARRALAEGAVPALLEWTLTRPGLIGGIAAGSLRRVAAARAIHGHASSSRSWTRARSPSRRGGLPSVSLTESIKSTTLIEKTLQTVPGGRDRRVAHGRRRDSDGSDGRRDQRHLRHSQRPQRVDDREDAR